MRRATLGINAAMVRAVHFYPRSPCGERPHIAACGLCDLNFYPRSPCGERLGVVSQDCVDALFLSTLSLRRATSARPETRRRDAISIHALLAESDEPPRVIREPATNFYPRSPCGERRPMDVPQYQILEISIHALLAESDGGVRLSCFVKIIFLSTLSLRRAT